MKMQIKCSECGEVLVTVEKEVISPEDTQGYIDSTQCSEHGSTVVSEIIE